MKDIKGYDIIEEWKDIEGYEGGDAQWVPNGTALTKLMKQEQLIDFSSAVEAWVNKARHMQF